MVWLMHWKLMTLRTFRPWLKRHLCWRTAVALWNTNACKSSRLKRGSTLGPRLDHRLQDPSSVQYISNNIRGPSSSKGPSPPCKVIRPLSVNLFNAPTSFSLQILEVRTCSDNIPPRGQYRIQMTKNAITVVREVISLVLAPNHVLSPTRLLHHIQPRTATILL
jgi:hypothetical protein